MAYMHGLPIKMLNFGRTEKKIKEWNIKLGNIEVIPLMSYKNYIESVYNSRFIISDSGSAQEEPALFNTPAVIPRDFTERPESVEYNCSIMIDVNKAFNPTWNKSFLYINMVLNGSTKINPEWLGDGRTSELIVNKIKEIYG